VHADDEEDGADSEGDNDDSYLEDMVNHDWPASLLVTDISMRSAKVVVKV